MSEIRSLKMVSGEEVICKLEQCTQYDLTISSPLVLQVMPAPGGGYGLGLIPWIHSKKTGSFDVNRNQIMVNCSPDKDVADGYLSQVSGIQLASSGNVLHS